jgi:glucokinase
MILAGDIGGTKSRLARVSEEGMQIALRDLETLPSREHSGLPALLEDYLARHPGPVKAACFAVAGPVIRGRSRITNLPWALDETALAERIGARRVVLINDLVGNAEGLAELPPEGFETLQDGDPDPQGNAALLSPGTGVGMAILHRRAGRLVGAPSEGGHAEYPARNDEEEALVRWLRERLGRVEIEDLLSGSGLVRIHGFLADRAGAARDPNHREPGPAEISRAGLEGSSPLALRALELFAEMLGSVAGNLALTALATAGLYIGGGIPPKILPALRDGRVLEAFLAKGDFRELLGRIPVRVVLDDRAALLGAGRQALRAGERL